MRGRTVLDHLPRPARRSTTPTGSRWSTAGGSPSSAPTRSCCAGAGSTRGCSPACGRRRGSPRLHTSRSPWEPAVSVAALDDGLTVLEHLSRNEVMDVYDVWDERRYCRCVAKLLRPDHEDLERDRERLLRGRMLLASPTRTSSARTSCARRGRCCSCLRRCRVRRSPPDRQPATAHGARRARDSRAAGRLGGALRPRRRRLHLDLKPSNVIIDAGFAKLIDFSLARAPGNHRAGIGTRPYLAPRAGGGWRARRRRRCVGTRVIAVRDRDWRDPV